MKKKCLIDVDGLLQVLQAIKDGKPVEYRPLEAPDWRDFDPENCEIDTENCKYRVNPVEYGDFPGVVPIRKEDLEEGRIYLKRSQDAMTDKGFICVKSKFEQWHNMIPLHFSWNSFGKYNTLFVCNVDKWARTGSEHSEDFANVICSNLVINDFNDVSFYDPSLAQVKMLEEKLQEIGYEFRNGQMKKINGNKA